MICECCNRRRAKHAQQRDYIRYVCTECSLLDDEKFYKKLNRRANAGRANAEKANI